MGYMKRIILIAVAAIGCCVMLAGCSGSTPSQTADSFLQAMKTQDTDAIATYYSGDASDMAAAWLGDSVGADIDTEKDLTDDEKAVMRKFADKLSDFDYRLGDEKIDGDSATVDVAITTYDFGKAVGDSFTEYLNKALTQAFSGKEMTTAASNKLFFKEFDKQLDKLTDKSQESSATLSLSKDGNGNWKVNELDSDAVNAITGQLPNEIAAYESALSGSSSSSSQGESASAD